MFRWLLTEVFWSFVQIIIRAGSLWTAEETARDHEKSAPFSLFGTERRILQEMTIRLFRNRMLW